MPRRGQRLNHRRHQQRASRLRREARTPRPGRHRMPPLHSSPPHPAAGTGAPSRLPPGLPQARHLAARTGNTAIQRPQLPRHPGCRTPGTPAPPPLHHRAAHLRQDPGTRRTRSGMRGNTGRQPSSSRTPGRLPRPARRHCSRPPLTQMPPAPHTPVAKACREQSSLAQAAPASRRKRANQAFSRLRIDNTDSS